MTETQVKKLYVSPDGMATFICPECGIAKQESVQMYQGHKGPIKVECPCANVYEVQLEFRRFYRKETNLKGMYIRASQPRDRGQLVIKDLSLGGCRCETWERFTLVPNEEIKLEFTLDDLRHSPIKKNAVVVHLNENRAGCRFSDTVASYDADLGFYLRNA
jgi:hypothetical protein